MNDVRPSTVTAGPKPGGHAQDEVRLHIAPIILIPSAARGMSRASGPKTYDTSIDGVFDDNL